MGKSNKKSVEKVQLVPSIVEKSIDYIEKHGSIHLLLSRRELNIDEQTY